jgi:Flp pilus assembly pilin Flp
MIRVSWHRRHTDESGQTLVEYTLILMFVALVTIGAVETIGTTVADFLSDAAAGVGGG